MNFHVHIDISYGKIDTIKREKKGEHTCCPHLTGRPRRALGASLRQRAADAAVRAAVAAAGVREDEAP